MKFLKITILIIIILNSFSLLEGYKYNIKNETSKELKCTFTFVGCDTQVYNIKVDSNPQEFDSKNWCGFKKIYCEEAENPLINGNYSYNNLDWFALIGNRAFTLYSSGEDLKIQDKGAY